MRTTWIAGLACLSAVMVLTGCVKRKERITIREDGSVTWQIKVTGDAEDMDVREADDANRAIREVTVTRGVPILGRIEGWPFSETRKEQEREDQQEITRTVERQFASVAEMPNTYPTNDTEGAELALQHPTSLKIEKTADGTYYHFRRSYEPRPSAYVNYWYEKLFEEYDDKDEDDMSRGDKLKFVADLVDVERRKQIALIEQAEASLSDSLPQLARLGMRDAVAEVYGRVDHEDILGLLEMMEDDDDDDDDDRDDDDDDEEEEDAEEKAAFDQMEALAKRVEGDVTEAVERSLRGKVSNAQARAFMEALAKERRRFEITEDYEDEAWEITLTLPGKLIAHNASKVENGNVVWEFRAGEFQDRQLELLATSLVESR